MYRISHPRRNEWYFLQERARSAKVECTTEVNQTADSGQKPPAVAVSNAQFKGAIFSVQGIRSKVRQALVRTLKRRTS